MKENRLTILSTCALLLVVMLAAGCVENSTTASTIENSQQLQGEKPSEPQFNTTGEHPANNETFRSDMPPAGEMEIPADGSSPPGMQWNGTPPSDMPMEGTPPSGTPPSEMPAEGRPPSDMQ